LSTPAWIAAPIATTIVRVDAAMRLFPKKLFTASMTFGMRVMPPTRMTSPISPADRPASRSAARHGSMVRWNQVIDQRLELVRARA